MLPLASSLDGRQFSFQAGVDGLELGFGGYVRLEAEGAATLEQVHSLALALAEGDAGDVGLPGEGGADPVIRTRLTIRLVRGHGIVLNGGMVGPR